MKIVFLSDDFPPESFGGAGISTYELAKGVQNAGHEVFVITTVRSEKEASLSDYDGLKVYKIINNYPEKWRAYRGLYNPPVIREVKKILKKINPDVVHANNIHYYLSYHSLKIAKKYSKAVILTFRDTMAITYGKLQTKKYIEDFDVRISWLDNLKQAKKRWNPFRNIIIKSYLTYVDKLFSVSNVLKKALEENGIKNVETLHTGIDTLEYEVSSERENKKIVFFAGRLSEAKGGLVATKVMEKVLKEIPDAIFFTAGTGGKWLNREEMKRTLANSRVILVPSVYLDPFPRAVLEGMAVGKPVVGTCFGGTPEAIVDGVTGYVVNPFNIELMTEKICDLLKDEVKARSLGKAGRERVRDKFNLEQKVKEYLDWYKHLVHIS
ncbi:MAG: Glycosyl transferase group 1, partial [Parcubacteria group bacterium GW2011_GWB1_38_8]|uniref:Glycosyltransferase subfamily 4-like N-terminal domain-containing protein n=1 Tax=Candidatus Zambryskibacteria bacterium RIFCSPLOWO2_02_FULL_39_14 TaxID=1802769 RepID=A0A1G2UIR2_9BACT